MIARAAGRRLFAAVVVMLATLVLGVLGSASPARAQTQAVQDLPGCAKAQLANADDVSSNRTSLGFTANFFGTAYTSVFVNQNGNLTFEGPVSTFTPFGLANSSVPIIAPFFADIDTTPSNSGQVTYGRTTVSGQPAFCVNWIGVGYYSDHTDKLNDIQLLLVSQPGGTGDFDIVFNYNKITWESGDASGGSGGLGGSSAAAGYSRGDGDPKHALVQPGSSQNGAFLDGNSTTGLTLHSQGSTQPGRYVYEVRNAQPPPPTMGTSANVKVVQGTVQVKEPGSNKFVDVSDASQIPVGSVVDTTDGTIRLTSAYDAKGHTQSAKFSGGIFKILQKKHSNGRTDLRLRAGKKFKSCGKKSRKVLRKLRGETGAGTGYTSRTLATTAKKKKHRNKFRTQGNFAAATVRGTVWGTIDRCDGTLTWVKKGTVRVRDLVRHRTVTVRAGHVYLARAPGH